MLPKVIVAYEGAAHHERSGWSRQGVGLWRCLGTHGCARGLLGPDLRGTDPLMMSLPDVWVLRMATLFPITPPSLLDAAATVI